MAIRSSLDTPSRHRGATVSKRRDGWAVSSAASSRPALFRTKAEAVAAAKRALAGHGGTLSVEGANGQITQTLTLGRDTAVWLNGIEGLAMNSASRRLLRDVQTSGMTPAQQRSAISAAFKK